MRLFKFGLRRAHATTVTESLEGPRSYSMDPSYINIDAGHDPEGRHYQLQLTREQAKTMTRTLIKYLGENMREPTQPWQTWRRQPAEWEAALKDLLDHYDCFFEQHVDEMPSFHEPEEPAGDEEIYLPYGDIE